ncbi:MAG: 3'-5' exonuclease domain-containing protein 2 [Bacteroidaceae bacterium]|jgi:ribonuclease D|nr:3'-5' exonuclease domain-containing protein 2 [Bacteroidaceae bacterium]
MNKIVSRFDKKLIPGLELVQFEGRIFTIDSEMEARKATDFLMHERIVGVDTETKPVFKKGRMMNPVALMQVSTLDTCFLFRLNRIGLPDCLVDLLQGDEVLKVGLSLQDDFRQLGRRRSISPCCYVELQQMVREFGITDMSLAKLYANLFGCRISKSQQLSNWEADVLSERQKRYAATDAWACVRIYNELNRIRKEGYVCEIIPEPVPEEGQG